MRLRFLLLAAASATALSAQAQAQTSTSPASDETAVEQIVITGTRVARSRLDTISPVDVIDNKVLTRQSTPELGQALANLAPSIDFPRPAITDGTDSVRPATLRGLSPDQTLVLINGRRGHASALVNVNGSIGRGSSAFDLNTIPIVALDRVEVLREGAAAQYGSDAIAGVINLRLRQASEGGGVSLNYGLYDTKVKPARDPDGRKAHDGVAYTLSAWQGFALPKDGFLTVSGEYSFRNPTNRGDIDPRPAATGHVTSRYGDPQVESKTIYANAGLPLNEVWSLYGWAGYQNRKTDSAANPRLADNAANIRSVYPTGFLPKITTNIDDYNFAFGTRGSVGGFDIDAALTYGDNKVHYGVIDSINASYGAASPTRFDAGTMEYGQFVASVDVTKPLELFSFAKPSTLAFGGEYRNETYQIGAGDTFSWGNGGNGLAAGAQGFPGFRPSNEVDKHRHSGSLYVDLDNQITEQLDVDIAARYENYSDFGSTTTGKIAARYDFTDNFALRGAASTGFRAPSLQQQFFTATSTNFINGVPVEVGTFPATSATARVLGGTQLKAEKSENYSAGLIYHKGPFELTIDAYQIKINNRIVLSENIQGSPTGDATARAIYGLLQPFGVSAARFFINGVDTTTKGVDVIAHYRLDAEAAGRFDFTLAGNINKTNVTRVPTTNTLSSLPVPPSLFARVNVLTYEEGTPKNKAVFTTDWNKDAWGGTLKVAYYDSVLAPQTNAALDYTTGSKALTDLEGRYTWNGATLAVGVNNLFDEYPDATPAAVNTNGPIAFSSYSPFGFNGRFLYTRLSYSW
ncbi:MAG: TonB-dependent receptor [Caulobacter sp.]|nr:TonB-dependent receptor [Caulobacter sp.]